MFADTKSLLDKLKTNPSNPRTIKKENYEKLKKSIREFPEMLEYRPIVYDENYFVLGGNQRLRAVKDLVKNENFQLKKEYFASCEGWSEDEKKEFIIKDNSPKGLSGEFDDEILANEYDYLPLEDYGLDIVPKEEKIEAEVEFTEELAEEHNYVVLYFDNDVDWLYLQSLYPLKTVQALDSKIGYKKAGVGRVVKGVEFIRTLLNGK